MSKYIITCINSLLNWTDNRGRTEYIYIFTCTDLLESDRQHESDELLGVADGRLAVHHIGQGGTRDQVDGVFTTVV